MTHLALVNTETGEVSECPSCNALQDQVAELESDLRRKRSQMAQLRRDKEQWAHNHPLWDDVRSVFGYWKSKCNHPRSKFTVDRFELALPYCKEYGLPMCRRAIDGAAYDPFTQLRRNGTTKRFDDWELVFRSADKFESFVNKAPLEAA